MPASSDANESENFCTPSDSIIRSHVVVVDTRGRRDRPRSACASATPSEIVSRPDSMILESGDRLERHRVHRRRPDELLDVEHVTIRRVLRRGRGPQAALRTCARGGQSVPPRPGEDIEVVLVRELRVVDGEPTLQILATDLGEAAVGLRVDARHEEARDRGDVGRISTRGDEPLEAANVRLRDGSVALEREDERDVDRAARRDRVLDRAEPGHRRRDLHEQVRAIDEPGAAAAPARTSPRARRRDRDRPRARRTRRHRPFAPRRDAGDRTRASTSSTASAKKTSRVSSECSSSARSCSSYQSPVDSAFSKIVGFDVTPTTASSSISRASSPFSSISRESESTQTLTPCVRELVQSALRHGSTLPRRDAAVEWPP